MYPLHNNGGSKKCALCHSDEYIRKQWDREPVKCSPSQSRLTNSWWWVISLTLLPAIQEYSGNWMSEEKLLLRWSLVLGCEPAQPKPSRADYCWPQPSPMVWKVRHATWVAFGSLSIIVCHCLRPGAGPWEHSPACLCLRRPRVTSYGEHLLFSLCLENNCVSLPSCRSIVTSFLSQWPGRTKLRRWPSFVCKAPSLFHAFIINIVAVSVCSLFSIAVCLQ